MILFRGSDSETVALTLFRSNMAGKAQNYLQLSSSLVVVSDDLLLCLLKPGEKIACFALSISANITTGIFLADWTRPVWNTGHLKRITAALQDAPI